MEQIEIGIWDGGNDSGWLQVTDPDFYHLETKLNDHLGYGGWAGNFSSHGTVYYLPDKKQILLTGDEYDSEEQEFVEDVTVSLQIPVGLLSDRLLIDVSNWRGVSVISDITDGMVTEKQSQLLDKVEEKLNKEFGDIEEYNFFFQEEIPMTSDDPDAVKDIEITVSLTQDKHIEISKTYDYDHEK